MFHIRKLFVTKLLINIIFILLVSVPQTLTIQSTCKAYIIASSNPEQKNGALRNSLIFPIDFNEDFNANTQSCRNNECFGALRSRLEHFQVANIRNPNTKETWKDYLCKELGVGEFEGYIGIEFIHHCINKNTEKKTSEMKKMDFNAQNMDAYYQKFDCLVATPKPKN